MSSFPPRADVRFTRAIVLYGRASTGKFIVRGSYHAVLTPFNGQLATANMGAEMTNAEFRMFLPLYCGVKTRDIILFVSSGKYYEIVYTQVFHGVHIEAYLKRNQAENMA